jgi:hypothetical protein
MTTMRRVSVVLSLTLLLIGLAATGWTTGQARAQESTPMPGGFEIAPGVMAEAIAFIPGLQEPTLYRLTFGPGVTYNFTPAPEISLVYGETGSLSITLTAPVTVFHAVDVGQPGEAVAAGDEMRIEVGDYVVMPPLVEGSVTNPGKESASVLVAAIVPLPVPEPQSATPVP